MLGSYCKIRGFENISEAIRDLDRVKLLVAGRIVDKEVLDRVLKNPNIRYKGLLRPEQALELEASGDVMVILYDLRIPINNYALPSKMFEAMMLGKAIITNLAPELMEQIGCGILVDYDNINQLNLQF